MSRGDIGNIWKALQKLEGDLNRALLGIGLENLSEELVHEINKISENVGRIEDLEEEVKNLRAEVEALRASVEDG